MNTKLTNIALSIKLFIAFSITWLILFKGNAGYIIHNIGVFTHGGNCFSGLARLLEVTLLYIVVLYGLYANYSPLLKIKNFLLYSDIILVITNLILGTYIHSTYYRMPLADAECKFVILALGSAFVNYLMGIVVSLLILKTQNQTEEVTEFNLIKNNNPLSFKGRMERLPYFITKLALFMLSSIIIVIYYQKEYMVIVEAILLFLMFTFGLFAASKRLRDIKWSQLFLIVWAIPIFGIVISLPLFFVKTKQQNI